MKKKYYIDFYKKNKISPVVNSFKKKYFFNQRSALYSHLSIDFNHINNKDVIEFGPGNGINSIHTFGYGPKSYNYVDANPTGLKNLKKNLEKYIPKISNYKINQSLIENYKTNQKFDLVLCEGLLPNNEKPQILAKYCGSFTKKNGIYVITCHDYISTLSETMRCFLSILITKDIKNQNLKILKLSQFFDKDFIFLKNMTRSKKDWIIDNFLNVEFWQDAKLFSISEAIKCLRKDFVFKSSSPNILKDSNWYKNIKTNNQKYFNNLAYSSYESQVLNLLDTRVLSNFSDKKQIEQIYKMSKKLRVSIKKTCKDLNLLPNLIEEFDTLSKLLPNDFNLTKKSINSYNSFLYKFYKNQKLNINLLNDFRAWWGRGMQYVSFQKI